MANSLLQRLYQSLPHPHRIIVEECLASRQLHAAQAVALRAACAIWDALEQSWQDITPVRQQALAALDDIRDDLALWAWLVSLTAELGHYDRRLDDTLRLLSYLDDANLSELPYTFRLLAPRRYHALSQSTFDYDMGKRALDRAWAILAEYPDSDAYMEFAMRRFDFCLNSREDLAEADAIIHREARRSERYTQRLGADILFHQAVFYLTIGRSDLLPHIQVVPQRNRLSTICIQFFSHLVEGDAKTCNDMLRQLDKLNAPLKVELIMRAHAALLSDDMAQFRRLINTVAPKLAQDDPFGTKVDQLVLLAALREGHVDHARLLLQRLDPNKKLTQFEDCWIRLHLLENDMSQAAAMLHESLSLGYPGRLVMQLGLAFEQSRMTLQRLWSKAWAMHEKPGTIGPSQTTTPPTTAHTSASQHFVGDHPSVHALRKHIHTLSQASGSVLLTGETGTGKEVVARMLHALSPQAKGPFVAVNCAGLPPSLAEAELFGHTKGAFTGADRQREGALSQASGGTLFLDELESIPPSAQALLLRVLEQGEFHPLGGGKQQRLRARVIAASNVSLESQVEAGTFRQDLFFRLDRLAISIPPLRQRRSDIAILAQHFIRQMQPTSAPTLGDDLLHIWTQHPWPGNVRELRNEIERIMTLHGSEPVLHVHHSRLGHKAPPPITASSAAPDTSPAIATTHSRDRLLAPMAHDRQDAIIDLLRKHGRLTQKQIGVLLQCSASTTYRSTRAMMQAGLITRVETSANLRTAYFILKEDSKGA